MSNRTYATRADLAQAIERIAAKNDAMNTNPSPQTWREMNALVEEARHLAGLPASKPKGPAHDPHQTAAEYWINGEAYPYAGSVRKRKRGRQGEYQRFVVTFADGTLVRGGTYDLLKDGSADTDQVVRYARSMRMQEEFRRLEARLPEAYQRAEAGNPSQLHELTEALRWHRVSTPDGPRCTRVAAIPEVAGVYPAADFDQMAIAAE